MTIGREKEELAWLKMTRQKGCALVEIRCWQESLRYFWFFGRRVLTAAV